MAANIFPDDSALNLLHDISKVRKDLNQYLFSKFGVKQPQTQKVILIAISRDDTMLGCDIMLSLLDECNRVYGKEVDTSSVKIVSLPSFEAAKRSPYLERASFILVTDEDLLEAENYPELKRILPFME